MSRDPDIRRLRTKGLYDVDKNLDLHKSQENHYVTECYQKHLGEIGGHMAHRLLHTHYQNRRRIADETILLGNGQGGGTVKVNVCAGTNCFLKGSQNILHGLLDQVREKNLQDRVQLSASFCFENCDRGPTVTIDSQKIPDCTTERAWTELKNKLEQKNGDRL